MLTKLWKFKVAYPIAVFVKICVNVTLRNFCTRTWGLHKLFINYFSRTCRFKEKNTSLLRTEIYLIYISINVSALNWPNCFKLDNSFINIKAEISFTTGKSSFITFYQVNIEDKQNIENIWDKNIINLLRCFQTINMIPYLTNTGTEI